MSFTYLLLEYFNVNVMSKHYFIHTYFLYVSLIDKGSQYFLKTIISYKKQFSDII